MTVHNGRFWTIPSPYERDVSATHAFGIPKSSLNAGDLVVLHDKDAGGLWISGGSLPGNVSSQTKIPVTMSELGTWWNNGLWNPNYQGHPRLLGWARWNAPFHGVWRFSSIIPFPHISSYYITAFNRGFGADPTASHFTEAINGTTGRGRSLAWGVGWLERMGGGAREVYGVGAGWAISNPVMSTVLDWGDSIDPSAQSKTSTPIYVMVHAQGQNLSATEIDAYASIWADVYKASEIYVWDGSTMKKLNSTVGAGLSNNLVGEQFFTRSLLQDGDNDDAHIWDGSAWAKVRGHAGYYTSNGWVRA